ncbi:MAG: signal peptidase II [Fimbriimonadales bacterium]
MRPAPFFIWFVALLIFDQLTKWLVRKNLAEGEFVTVIPYIFDLTLVYNRGIAFGLFQGAGVLLSPLAALVAVFAGIGYLRSKPQEKLFRVGMVLLAAGALGNLVDRVFGGGKVTDFIDIKIIHVFNVADACITIAATLLIIHWVLELRNQSSPRVDTTQI